MCQRITCSTCGKPTFAGCGRHIEAVLGDVPAAERCHCRESAGNTSRAAANPAKGGRLAELFRTFRRPS